MVEINLKKPDDFRLALRLLSPVLGQLTDTEIDIINFCVKNGILEINKGNRVDLSDRLGVTIYNFNNYVSRLMRKKILVKGGVNIRINPVVLNLLNENEIKISFV